MTAGPRDRLLDALGVPEEADRVERLVAALAAMVAERFDVGLDEARVPVEGAAGRLRDSESRAALAYFTEDLAGRVAAAFGDRRAGTSILGLGPEQAARQRAAEETYEIVNAAAAAYWYPEDWCPEEDDGAAARVPGLGGWVS